MYSNSNYNFAAFAYEKCMRPTHLDAGRYIQQVWAWQTVCALLRFENQSLSHALLQRYEECSTVLHFLEILFVELISLIILHSGKRNRLALDKQQMTVNFTVPGCRKQSSSSSSSIGFDRSMETFRLALHPSTWVVASIMITQTHLHPYYENKCISYSELLQWKVPVMVSH